MFSLNCKGRLLLLDQPVVMGILNTSPDSFYKASVAASADAMARVEQMIRDGAAIIDVGGQSTRPGSEPVDQKEELKRVIPVIENIHSRFPGTIISIDTYNSNVASLAVKAGASIVNDISGGSLDEKMIDTVADLQVPYICMHMKGTPATMQSLAQYEDVTLEVMDYFIAKLDHCRKAGINDLVIDPGFGFAKTAAQNFKLLKEMKTLAILDTPVLVGLSRKSTIYRALGTDAAGALNGTTVLNTVALMNGASILRVHDVKEAAEAIKLHTAMSSV